MKRRAAACGRDWPLCVSMSRVCSHVQARSIRPRGHGAQLLQRRDAHAGVSGLVRVRLVHEGGARAEASVVEGLHVAPVHAPAAVAGAVLPPDQLRCRLPEATRTYDVPTKGNCLAKVSTPLSCTKSQVYTPDAAANITSYTRVAV